MLDPVLTLSDGTKLRVYQGGDPTYMIVEAASIIENHDNKNKVVEKPKKTPITKPKSRPGKISFFKDDDYFDDDYYYDLGFPSLGDYDLDDKD